jgi:hypothetical protein
MTYPMRLVSFCAALLLSLSAAVAVPRPFAAATEPGAGVKVRGSRITLQEIAKGARSPREHRTIDNLKRPLR